VCGSGNLHRCMAGMGKYGSDRLSGCMCGNGLMRHVGGMECGGGGMGGMECGGGGVGEGAGRNG